MMIISKKAPLHLLITSRAAAILIVAMALIVMVGWHLHIPSLIQIHSSLTPMQYNTALCFLLSGAAMVASTFSKLRVAILLGLITSIIASLTLSQHIFSLNYGIDELLFKHYIFTNTSHPGRMSPLTALVFTMGGIATLFASLTKYLKYGPMICGVLGSLIIALGTMAVFGYVTGLLGIYGWSQFTRMALHTGAGTIILGLGLINLAWYFQLTRTSNIPSWLPFAAVLAAFTTTLIIWDSLVAKEKSDLDRLTAANTEIIQNEIIASLDSRYRSLNRMSKRWGFSNVPLEIEWRNDTLQYIKDFPGYLDIFWLNDKENVRWSARQSHLTQSLSDILNSIQTEHLEPNGKKIGLYSQTVRLLDESLGILLPLPVEYNNEPEGFIIGIFQLQKLLDATLHKNIIAGYSIQIKESGSVIYERIDDPKNQNDKYGSVLRIKIHGVDWTIKVQPEPKMLATLKSPYPLAVLILGTLFSGFMALSIQLASSSNARAKLLAETNIILTNQISERKRAQRELEELGTLQEGILTHAAYAVISTTPNGIITSFNPAAERMLGYHANEVINIMNLQAFHDPSEIKEVAEALPQDLNKTLVPGFIVIIAKSQSGKTENLEWTYIRKDGSRFPVSLVVTALRNQSDEIVGYLSIAGDISELKKINHHLKEEINERRKSEEALKFTQFSVDNAADENFWVNMEGDIIYANRATCDQLGYSSKAIKSLSAIHILPNLQDGDWETFWENATNQGRLSFESIQKTSDGKLIPIEITTNYLDFSDKKLLCISIRNISERLRILDELSIARDEALTSVRIKSRFLANMSHEIRTPMNGIMGIAEILSNTSLSDEQSDYLNTIRSSADLLMDIINSILDSSKIESGKIEFKHQEFDIHEMIDGVIDVIRGIAHLKNLEIAYIIEPDVDSYLMGDDGRIRQVLTNIIGNSVKFTEFGEVILSVSCLKKTTTKTTLEFKIQDTGIGISEQDLPHIFDPFRQADDTDTRKYGGTGLGLTISRQIIEALGGRIEAESLFGVGTIFRFHLDFEISKTPHSQSKSAPSFTNHFRALIVDNNETNRKILTLQLTSLNIQSYSVSSGLEALQILQKECDASNPFHLAIIDMQMPVMSGTMLIEAIRKQPSLDPLKLMILSSIGEHMNPVELEKNNINAYLIKPIKQRQLGNVILSIIDNNITTSSIKSRSKLTPTHPPARPVNSIRILIAEDNPVNQKVATLQVKKLGYSADIVANGEQAVEAIKKNDYDLILMDCQMPVMNGFTATSKIRTIQRKPITIIAMTANAMEGDREKCIDAGMDDYLSKPFSLEELSQIITKHINDLTLSAQEIKQPSIMDMDRFMKITDGSRKMLIQISNNYLKQAEEILESIRVAIEQRSMENATKLAHKLCRSSSECGIIALIDPLRKIEHLKVKSDFKTALSLLREADAQLLKVRAFIKNRI